MFRTIVRVLAVSLPAMLLGCPLQKEERPPADPSGVYLSIQGVTREPSLFVRGLVDRDATAEVYFDPECRGALANSGRPDTFASQGLQIVLPPNVTTIVAARARRGELRSGCVLAASITHDDVAPEPPKVVSVQMAGVAPVRVAVSGTAEAASKLRLYYKGGCQGGEYADTTVEGNGTFRVETPAAANATTVFSATTTDAAGNVSGCSQNFSFTHDDQPPAPPKLNAITPSVGTQAQINVTGTTEPNAQVRLFRDPACAQSLSATAATASGSGSFSLLVNVSQNQTTQIYGRATDPSGNPSACSTPISYTHDSIAPTPPVLGPSNPTSPSNQLNFQLEFTAEPLSRLQLYGAAGCQGGAILDGTMPQGGIAAANLSGANNATRSFSARSTDVAGNASNCSQTFSYTHDGVAPAAPVLTATVPANLGNTTSPQVTGTAEPFSTVRVYRAANCTGLLFGTSVQATGAGQFSVTGSVTSNTTTTFSAQATDATGNVSPCSTATLTYTHDGIAPSAPVLVGTLPPSPSRSTAVQVLGMGEPGSTAQVFASSICSVAMLLTSGPVGPVPAGGTSGRGPFELSVTVPADTITPLAVNLRDEAGNTSSCIALTGGYAHDSTRGWREVSALEAPAVEGHTPALVLTPTGATALWARLDGTTTSTIVAADWSNGAWSAPQTVAPTGTHLLDPVRVAADGAGNLYAVFSRYGAGPAFSGEAFGVRRPAGGPWDAPVSFGAETYEPDVAAGGNGEVVSAFRVNLSGGESQLHARRFTSGLWDVPVRVDTTAQNDFAPRVAVTTTGDGLVLYTINQGTVASPVDELWSVRFSGGNWQAPQRRSASGMRVRRGEYAIMSGGTGRAVAAWLESTSSTSSLFRANTTRYSTTGFNSTNTTVGTTSSDLRGLTLAVNGSDAAMLMATNQSSGQLNWSRSTAHTTSGSGFSTSLSTVSSPAAVGSPVKVAYGDTGTVYAAWIGADRMESGGSSLWMSTWTSISGWTAPQLLERTIDPLDTFELAVNNDRVVAVWSRTDGTGARSVRARVLD